MLLLKELDNRGVALRKRHKLQRIYISKVSGQLYVIVMILFDTNFLWCIGFRDLTSYGILMGTINCLNLDFVSMAVLTGNSFPC